MDSRLLSRLQEIVGSVQQSPDQSFPAIFPEKAKLDGFYRFMSNPRVDTEEIIRAVSEEALERVKASQEKVLLAVHDSTTFCFAEGSDSGSISGIGRISSKKKGFFGHFCLGVNLNREIIGVLGLKTWIRSASPLGKRKATELRADPKNEKRRWSQLMHEVQSRLGDTLPLVHVADREADDYATVSELKGSNIRFVIRANHNRTLLDRSHPQLWDSLRDTSVKCEREVPISARKPGHLPRYNKAHPPRNARIAQLGISAKMIEIPRSSGADPKLPRSIQLNFVRVLELQSSPGETPIEWVLITSEPIESPEDLFRIVDIYRARWTIEEYFKGLKTGCAFEKRGFQTLGALLNCLAVLAPIACKLYNLKKLAIEDPECSSSKIISPTQLEVLSQKLRLTLHQLQTAEAALNAIAALGGHRRHSGPPGWQVLIRGFEKLLILEQGWLLAIQSSTLPLTHRDM